MVLLLITMTACAKKQLIKPSINDLIKEVTTTGKQPGTSGDKMLPVPATKTDPGTEPEPDIRNTTITKDPNMETIYFEFDKCELSEEARTVLKTNADYMKLVENSMFCVEGHCDERGTVEYNLALGQRRASAVRQYYKMLGVKSTWIATISYGEEKPAVEGTGEEVWAKNRRAETRRMYEKEK